MKWIHIAAILAVPCHGFSLFQDLLLGLGDTYGREPKNLHQEVQRIADDSVTTILSDIDSRYSLRVKEIAPEKLGVDTVKQWSGYLDYEDSKHWFYWFFESRNDPEHDPLILWLNGGPGCSSFTGLLFELGPSSIGSDIKPINNPYSWNNNASVLFLEQPLGVGFSYGDEKITTTKAAGKDVYIFLELFFSKFPHLRSHDFHISGESYAGHYIPQIAHEIVVENPGRSFDLTSVLIGNGITDSLVQDDYYEPMACGQGGYPAVLTEEQCGQMSKDADRCRTLNRVCYTTKSNIACIAAATFCDSVTLGVYEKTGRNFYDIRGPCEDEGEMCYYGLRYVDDYMNLPEVQKALGSDVHNYTGCSNQVGLGFMLTGDGAKPFQQFVAELLDMNIPVLLYAGDKDFICNWLGNRAWSDKLDWRYGDQYQQLPLKAWKSDVTGEEFGQVKNYGPLTFLRVYDAGHMVPYDQPEAALEMVNTWISGVHDFGYMHE
ncbi:YBR139W [Zygosaccharomyces parabailii]|nr:YBR139W [Zygosaccharomyces parabailii]CDH12657.1 related to serine carboxypeptidase YBR139W [Zygosaccharomyces bailii ISA1307]